jgi:hypothetical protein
VIVRGPDTLLRLTETFHEARAKIVGHLYGKAHPDPALSTLVSGR